MKKWFFIIFVLLLIVVSWRSIALYQSTMKVKLDEQQIAHAKVVNENMLQNIDDVTTYYGTKTYHIFTGDDLNGEKVIVFLPEDIEENTVTRKPSTGVSKEEALQILLSNPSLNPKEIRSIKLGIEKDSNGKDTPIWEIIYLDQNNRLTYYRAYFETGQFWILIKP